ncbi:MAG: YceI family protein [Pirellulaceae bacterium]|jgi:polyisoprenoid-binding protein YceI|nr:YceI family protein [Pirellulaceae bacterium]MDP7018315.1 YceI family protein [Pirellulaceae bacterium]
MSLLLVISTAAGCGRAEREGRTADAQPPSPVLEELAKSPPAARPAPAAHPGHEVETVGLVSPAPVKPVGDTIEVRAENTRLSFVSEQRPNPILRTGGFSDFSGAVVVDKGRVPTGLSLEVNTASLWSPRAAVAKLWRDADFFRSHEFPIAKFESASIVVQSQDGERTELLVEGQLTIAGQTATISFPASFEFFDGGGLLIAGFAVDRSQFGLDRLLDQFEDEIQFELSVGQATRVYEVESDDPELPGLPGILIDPSFDELPTELN